MRRRLQCIEILEIILSCVRDKLKKKTVEMLVRAVVIFFLRCRFFPRVKNVKRLSTGTVA